MRVRNAAITNSAIGFAGQFGFLSREIFFRYLCPLSIAGQYSFWDYLVESGLFYQSKGNRNVLHLAPKGFALAGPHSVKGRSHIFINHDALVGEALFILSETGLLERFWTEGVLKQVPWDALGILGGDNLEKVPDLVVDLKGAEKMVRIAVEVEACLKTKNRYDQMALGYTRIPNVDFILFLCENRAVELQITRAFDSEIFNKTQKAMVTALIAEASDTGLLCDVRLKSHTFKLEEVLRHVLKIERFPSLPKLKDNKNSFLLWRRDRKAVA